MSKVKTASQTTPKTKARTQTPKTAAAIASSGGKARAKALTATQKATIAKKAATARWGPKPKLATHRGNFKDEFGIDVECYVLNDEQKTAVISQRGMGAAMGLVQTGGSSFRRFLGGEKIAPYVGPELREKLENPLVFQWSASVPNTQPAVEIHGYDVTILIDVCKAILEADSKGELLARQQPIVKQARIIQNASAKAGIKGLVYALAGYDAVRAEVIAAFKFFVQAEAREYEKEFPPALYGEWYRLYNLPKYEAGKPWKFKDLTVKQVYTPLARSNGKILALTREQKAASDDSHAKLHQFLSEIGTKALRTHLGQLLGIAQVSENREEYERHVTKVFGGQISLDFEGQG